MSSSPHCSVQVLDHGRVLILLPNRRRYNLQCTEARLGKEGNGYIADVEC
ncbi:MAG: hypothetical protein IJV55_03480 [Paludibacteraceae bacterium]|nr:hypothetical protein [Paludibacteraceae bacterium]